MNSHDERMQIARTILEQLGGKMFQIMTGARDFVAESSGLTFKIGSNAKNINAVRVTLTPMDVYTVEFIRIHRAPRLEAETVETVEDVYNDMLPDVFTNHTGLYTRM